MQRGDEIERETVARRRSVQRQDAGRALLFLNQQRESGRVSCGLESSIRDFPSRQDSSVKAKFHSRVDIRLHFLHGQVLGRRLARELIAAILEAFLQPPLCFSFRRPSFSSR